MTIIYFFFLADVVCYLNVYKEDRVLQTHRNIQEILKLGLTFPSCCSVRENASMNAWAITDRQPSMCGVFLMSKTN